MTDKPLVLVTGASGYIAMHTIIQLLKEDYRVRGTLRSLNKESRLRNIFAEYVDANERLEFVTADLTSDDGWDAAMQDCTYVLHLASPFPLAIPKSEDELIKPAVEGTKRVLQAALNANVKRVIQTSSVAAIRNSATDIKGKIWNEDDWADPNSDIGAYAKSKTLAERAAWDFVSEHPQLELVVINPSLVLGPVFDDNFSNSIEAIRKLMRKDYPGVPNLGFSVVDVRDVATAHITAMTHPDALGKRFCCVKEFIWMKDMAEIINRNFATQGYKVATRPLPNFVMRIAALFDETVKGVVGSLGKRIDISNERIKTTLNWQPYTVEESIVDTGKSLIEKGIV